MFKSNDSYVCSTPSRQSENIPLKDRDGNRVTMQMSGCFWRLFGGSSWAAPGRDPRLLRPRFGFLPVPDPTVLRSGALTAEIMEINGKGS
ncbi:hypothetical protein OPV22_008429 [Ensete ventricosum]|uniref:Uncharacterized protein n=1 Tax=Ensete ventricosum TaxID=4639 RepID=A0AAV8RC83_ENSVE|nr:hypothetical protein OPV22_008429 [Ensete ventricosum]